MAADIKTSLVRTNTTDAEKIVRTQLSTIHTGIQAIKADHRRIKDIGNNLVSLVVGGITIGLCLWFNYQGPLTTTVATYFAGSGAVKTFSAWKASRGILSRAKKENAELQSALRALHSIKHPYRRVAAPIAV